MFERDSVTIRGETYRSHQEAADALGVTRPTVSEAKKFGWLDSVGLNIPKFLPGGAYNPSWLSRFLATNKHLTDFQLAEELSLPLHRVHYLLSADGWALLMKDSR